MTHNNNKFGFSSDLLPKLNRCNPVKHMTTTLRFQFSSYLELPTYQMESVGQVHSKNNNYLGVTLQSIDTDNTLTAFNLLLNHLLLTPDACCKTFLWELSGWVTELAPRGYGRIPTTSLKKEIPRWTTVQWKNKYKAKTLKSTRRQSSSPPTNKPRWYPL